MTSEEIRIDSFLRLGYFIDYAGNRAPIDFSRIDKTQYSDAPFEELLRLGEGKLRDTFSQLKLDGREHVVPLSGGFDSRLILGALLEHFEGRNLYTYTFGIAGSYDYEIGNAIAGLVGTRHTSIPLNKEKCRAEDEVETALRTDCQGMLFHHPPLSKLDRLYRGALFWSGFGGDGVSGKQLRNRPFETLQQAKRYYLRNRSVVKSTRLARGCDDDLLPFVEGGELQPDNLSWEEQIFFQEAMPKFTAPLILFSGFDFATPLINSPWMDFMFSAPNRHRLGQRLMTEIGRSVFPRLFGVPSKNRLGHTLETPDTFVKATFWINRLRKLAHRFIPLINYPIFQYRDVNEEIRSEPSLRAVVRDSIEDLRRRRICDWIDFDGIWRRHDRRIRNHGDALIVLASLELILKAREVGASG